MNKKGFTLIELLAIIVILAVIMAIAIPQVLNVVNGSKSSAWKDNIKMISKAIELNTQLYDPETGNYAYTVESLCKNPTKVNEISKSSDTTVTCSNGIFIVAGTGQFDGFYANISCTGNECKPNVFSENNKFCELKSGKALEIGSKYECDPGDGTKRNFYVLIVNSNTVDLIMERNLSDTVGNATMTWNDALDYFTTGAGVSTKTSWKNVINVDLPSANAIAKAAGEEDWVAENNSSWWCLGSKVQDLSESPYCNATTNKPYAWLFEYLIGCTKAGCNTESNATAHGYWTKNLNAKPNYAWRINWHGAMTSYEVSHSVHSGVRPVITVLKSNLD